MDSILRVFSVTWQRWQ